jgi:hypothetical protein
MTHEDWQEGDARSLTIRLSGEAGIMYLTQTGEQEPDDTFLLLINAGHEDAIFVLPDEDVATWQPLMSTMTEYGHLAGYAHALPGLRNELSAGACCSCCVWKNRQAEAAYVSGSGRRERQTRTRNYKLIVVK